MFQNEGEAREMDMSTCTVAGPTGITSNTALLVAKLTDDYYQVKPGGRGRPWGGLSVPPGEESFLCQSTSQVQLAH